PEYIMNVKQSDTRLLDFCWGTGGTVHDSHVMFGHLLYESVRLVESGCRVSFEPAPARVQVQHVINFTEGPSRDDVDKHWKDQIPEFVQRIAPQPEKKFDNKDEGMFLLDAALESPTIFRFRGDWRRPALLRICTKARRTLKQFCQVVCLGYPSFNWTTVRYIHLSDLAIQAATSLFLLFSISTLRDEAPEWCANLPWFALAGLPFVTATVIMRLCEVVGNKMREPWELYTEAVELILAVATMALFIVFMIPPSSGALTCTDRGVVDHLSMRAAIIVTSSLRLMHNIDMLRLAFSEVNMIVTPIISALARSLPFCLAVIYFAFIMWQAYWTLDVEEWQNGWKAVIIAWRFAVLGDFEVDELEGQEGTWHQDGDGSMWTYEDPDLTDNSTLVRGVFIVLCGMMFPVLIMNILISVLSVWLDFAITNAIVQAAEIPGCSFFGRLKLTSAGSWQGAWESGSLHYP
ncbi:unnamed protein product, partial [Symbiodinium natans]